jgi:hypothetical protein
MARRETFISTLQALHLDIDVYLNPILPVNPLKRLPISVSYLFGHRTHPVHESGSVFISIWALITTYVGLLMVTLFFKYSSWVQSLDPPVIIGSLVCAAPEIVHPVAHALQRVLLRSLSSIRCHHHLLNREMPSSVKWCPSLLA